MKSGIFTMEKEEKNNILWILSNTKRAIKSKDALKLKELSNHTIHSASIYQDPSFVMLAVLVYSLGKVIERGMYMPASNWKLFSNSCIKNLSKAESPIKEDNIEEFQNYLVDIRQEIIKLAGPMGKNIEEVFRKAMINKASKIYEHGISEAKTAELLGISIWELAEYAGQTAVPDVNLGITQDIRTRITKALKFFEQK